MLGLRVVAMPIQCRSAIHAADGSGGLAVKAASFLAFYIIGSRADKHRILAAEIRNLAMLGYHIMNLSA
jgi:hypothetical protein